MTGRHAQPKPQPRRGHDGDAAMGGRVVPVFVRLGGYAVELHLGDLRVPAWHPDPGLATLQALERLLRQAAADLADQIAENVAKRSAS